MARTRVLVVEDRPSVLKLISTVLEVAHEVTSAPDGAAALALLASRQFDVVLTDVRMPGASGFDVLRAVRARWPRTRVVMITAYANVADAVAAMRLGAHDYLAKPLDASEIALVVARAVEERADGADAALDPEPDLAHPVAARDDPTDGALGFHRAVEEARRRASRDYLVRLMRRFHGNVTQAAQQAGLTRESLYRVLRQYEVHPEQHREGDAATPADPAQK